MDTGQLREKSTYGKLYKPIHNLEGNLEGKKPAFHPG